MKAYRSKFINMEHLINWKALSRYLAGNETSISKNRIPKKYQGDVNSLIDHLKAWEEKIKENTKIK